MAGAINHERSQPSVPAIAKREYGGELLWEFQRAAEDAAQMRGSRSASRFHYFSLSLNILPVILLIRWIRPQAGQVTTS